MPLTLPNLDDRRWSDLVEEGRALIPRHAPQWTDHNVHDPGIMLAELFAWLTETGIYRLNQIPDRHRRKFLALLGLLPRPPQPAQTILTMDLPAGEAPFELPAGTQFLADAPAGQPVLFSTMRTITVAPVQLDAVQVDSGDGQIRDRTLDWRDGLALPVLGIPPRPGAALYLGFSRLPVQMPISMAFWFQGPGNDRSERERLLAERNAQEAACRPVQAGIDCPDAGPGPAATGAGLLQHHSARLVWEAFTSDPQDPWFPLQPIVDGSAPAEGQVRDDTRALTLDGFVELNLPGSIVATPLAEIQSPLFYVRGRLLSGAFDAPPLLKDIGVNAVAAEQAAPVAQSSAIPAGVTPVDAMQPAPGDSARLTMQLDSNGAISALEFIDPAVAGAEPELVVLDYQPPTPSDSGRLVLEAAVIGRATARPNQAFSLPLAPVLLDSIRLYTHESPAWKAWERRSDFHASRRTDRHWILDATTGELRFGDGEHGLAPSPGSLVVVTYRATLGAAGNVAAGAISKLASTPRNDLWLSSLGDTDVRVAMQALLATITVNRYAAAGGADAESLDSAIGRAFAIQHAHERLQQLCQDSLCQTLDGMERSLVLGAHAPGRAVNLLDMERLALDVPGTRIARARAWPNTHPAYPCLQAPGVVTVVVLPDMSVPRPEPSPGLISAVRRYLDRRRMITTRLEVVGPHYLEVQVLARVRLLPFVDAAGLRSRIIRSLDAFLDPRTGGPDGLGWPFGRDVYRSEILQILDTVPGVDHVLELDLKGGDGEPQCGNLSLCPTWLVTPGPHQIDFVRAQ